MDKQNNTQNNLPNNEKNPNMQGSLNQGQTNQNGQQPILRQFNGQDPKQGPFEKRQFNGQNPYQTQNTQPNINNQQSTQAQSQAMPQNQNMNPQEQGYYQQPKTQNELVMKFKELWHKDRPKMIGIFGAIATVLVIFGIYMNQTKYERALKHGTYEVSGTYATAALDAYNTYQDTVNDDDDDDDSFGFGLFGSSDDEDEEDDEESSSEDNDYKLYLAFDNDKAKVLITDHIPTATDIKNESTYSSVKVKGDTLTLDNDDFKIKKSGSSYELNGKDDSMRLTKVN